MILAGLLCPEGLVQHEGPSSNIQTPRVILDKSLLFSGPRDSISIIPSKGHCGVLWDPHLPHPHIHPFSTRDLFTLQGPIWLTPPLTRSLGVSCGICPPTLSLGAWLEIRSFRTGSYPGLNPNLPGRRSVGNRERKRCTLPVAHMCAHRQSGPHFTTMASCLFSSAPDLTIPCPSRGIPVRDTPDPGARVSTRQDATPHWLVLGKIK